MIRGRKYSCWAALPNVINTGATIFNAKGICGGAPAVGTLFLENVLLDDIPIGAAEAARPHPGAPAAAI